MRRDTLYDSASDDEGLSNDAVEDEAMRAKLNAQLSSLFAVDFAEPMSEREAGDDSIAAASHAADPIEEQEEEFEFRLFSTAKTGPQKVVLEHDEDSALQNQEGGLVVPNRPASFYLAGELTPEQRASYSSAAITAEDIYAMSKTRAWGLEVPWRVKKITLSKSKTRTLSRGSSDSLTTLPVQEEEQLRKRKRPGKKRRVLLRTKDKAKKEQQAAAEKQKMSKEEHLKEKKKRLNREKKLKRRQKDKEKKHAQAAGNQMQEGNAEGQQEPSESESD